MASDAMTNPEQPDTRPRCGETKDGWTCGLERGHLTAFHEHFREVGGSMVWAITASEPTPDTEQEPR